MDTAREERDHRRLFGGDRYLLEGHSLAVLRQGRSRPPQPPPNSRE
jgi:hypothetical protein